MNFDGEDWIYENGKHSLVYHQKVENPSLFAGQNIPLFTFAYTPKIGDIIFDVGAGIGEDIEVFSSLVGQTGKVIAIEADPICFRRLVKLVNLLELKNVTCINVAVSDFNGNAWITQDREDGLGNFISDVYLGGSKEISLRKFSSLLEELGISEVDYMKVNIEGSETVALKGLGEALSKIKNICVSCHDFLPDPQMHTFNQVCTHLLSAGFNILKHPTNPKAVWESWYLYASKFKMDPYESNQKMLAERDNALAERDNVLNSTTWKIFMPYRKIKKFIKEG